MIKELVVHEDPKSPISEIFRTLRTNIQFMNTKKKLQTILTTSTMPGEGKSWISANLAATFAQAEKKVILIDADMRKGRQYRIFNISPRPGLSNYLSEFVEDNKETDLANYIQETAIDNLFVIAAGNVPPNPSELLVSESMMNLINKLREVFDIIIIDGPPTQLVTDSLILTRITDTTVIVAESSHAKKTDLHRMIDNIKNVGGNIAGVVLNKVPQSSRRYEQSYYYGSTQIKKRNKFDFRGKRESSNTPRKEEIATENKNRNTQRVRELLSQNKEKKSEDTQEQELPDFLKEKKHNEVETSNINTNILNEETKDILKQVNDYLDQEKRNLN